MSFQLLSVFCEKYSPATQLTATDYFTSIEILSMLVKHIGETITLVELHQAMREMGYEYAYKEDGFVWLCKKDE